jgi:hypothetical protein
LFYEEFVKWAGFLGRSGHVEGRTLAAANVSIESELGDCQHASANIPHAAVHFSFIVIK